MENIKKELLGRIMRVQEEINHSEEGDDCELIEKMRKKILQIVEDNSSWSYIIGDKKRTIFVITMFKTSI